MCVYCAVGDFYNKWHPIEPAKLPEPVPLIVPTPVFPLPIEQQEIERLKGFLDILERVKKIEDQLGCPCDAPEDRGKPDYLKKLTDRIAALERRVNEAKA
jgi:hypothetical protein